MRIEFSDSCKVAGNCKIIVIEETIQFVKVVTCKKGEEEVDFCP